MTQLAIISKIDQQAYPIQEGFTSFAASEPTSISSVEITADVTTVQEYAEYTIKFQPDVEIEAGAFFMIQFPLSDDNGQEVYSFDNNLNSMTTIGGLFGSRSDGVDFTTDRENLKIETKLGTQRYSTVSVATVIISKIKNPAYFETFKSFKISVFDKYKQLIAKVGTDLKFKTSPGSMTQVKVTPVSFLIDEVARLSFEFKPVHTLPADAKLRLSLTDELGVTCPNSEDISSFEYNSDQLNKPLEM